MNILEQLKLDVAKSGISTRLMKNGAVLVIGARGDKERLLAVNIGNDQVSIKKQRKNEYKGYFVGSGGVSFDYDQAIVFIEQWFDNRESKIPILTHAELYCTRKKLGLTHAELAKMLNVTKRTIIAWESAFSRYSISKKCVLKLQVLISKFNREVDEICAIAKKKSLHRVTIDRKKTKDNPHIGWKLNVAYTAKEKCSSIRIIYVNSRGKV